MYYCVLIWTVTSSTRTPSNEDVKLHNVCNHWCLLFVVTAMFPQSPLWARQRRRGWSGTSWGSASRSAGGERHRWANIFIRRANIFNSEYISMYFEMITILTFTSYFQQNQIDMNRQSDMMAAFEENII